MLLSVVSAMFWPVVNSFPPLSSHSAMRSSAAVVNPLVLKLLLFPVKTSTTLYPCSAMSDGNACVHAFRYVKLTPSPVSALMYMAE